MIRFYGLNDAGATALFVSLVICGILAIIGSSITFSYYYKKNTIVPKLYKILAIFDILTGLDAIYFVILCFTYLKDCNTGYYSVNMYMAMALADTAGPYNDPNHGQVAELGPRDDGGTGPVYQPTVPVYQPTVPVYQQTGPEHQSGGPVYHAYQPTAEDWTLYYDNSSGCHRNDTFLVPASFVITAVVTRLPLFVGVVLSVVRTINIAQPFYKVNTRSAIVSIAVWFMSWALLAVYATLNETCFECSNDEQYYLKDSFYRLLTNSPLPDARGEINNFRYLLMMMAGFLFPLAVMLFNTIAQIAILYRNKISNSSQDSAQLQITITIILITCLALACGMPSSMYVAASWSKAEVDTTYNMDMTQAFVYGFALPVLNSALNPLLLIVRSARLREHCRKISSGKSIGTSSMSSVRVGTSSTITRVGTSSTTTTRMMETPVTGKTEELEE